MATGDSRVFHFTDPLTGFAMMMTVSESEDGTLLFVVDVDESEGTTGDLRALYLNNTDDSFYSGLQIVTAETDGDVTTTSDTGDVDLVQNINRVRSVEEKDTTINGEVLHENEGRFDTGVEFGSSGIGVDDVQHMEFVLTADQPLSIDDFDFSTIGLRVTSVGDVDGSREDSLKLTGEEVFPEPEPEPDPNLVIAEDDFATVAGEDLLFGDAILLGNVSLNDSDPDGDLFGISSVSGGGVTDTTPDEDGWFDWIGADQGGEIRINTDGSFEFRDVDNVFDGGEAILFPVETSVQYEVLDERGATDTATVTVEVMPFDPSGDIFD